MIKNNWIIKPILIGLCCVSGADDGSCPDPYITPELPHSITTESLPTNYELTPSVMLEQLLKENAVCRESVIRIESILIEIKEGLASHNIEIKEGLASHNIEIKEGLASHNSILSSMQSSIQSIALSITYMASYMASYMPSCFLHVIQIKEELASHNSILSSIQSSIQSIASYMASSFLQITDVLTKIRNSGAHSAILLRLSLARANNRENNSTNNNHQQGSSAIPERIDARLTDLNSWFNFFRKGYNTSRLP